LYYIWGGWIGSVTYAAREGGSYSCARCHTTGFAIDNSAPEPLFSFPSINLNLDPDAGGPATTSSWTLDGVQCERCHGQGSTHAAGPSINNIILPSALASTDLCMSCHRQEHQDPNTGVISVNNPPQIEVSNSGNFAITFYGYSTGQEFLNSPHARFTGTSGDILNAAKYQSNFQSSYGGCSGCHDVHESTVPEINALASTSMKNACGINCHSNMGNFGLIKHPTGPGTPIGAGSDVTDACAICHMPVASQGGAAHLFRISTDPNYSTFPTPAQYGAGQRTANTSPDGIYTTAVWVDLDLACGQCHGGSAGPGATTNGAMYLDKNYLAAVATGMHASQDLPPTVSHSAQTVTVNGLSVSFTDNSAENNSKSATDLVVEVNWDDGSVSFGPSGSAFSHTYASGGVFNILHTVSEGGNQFASEFIPVTVSATAGSYSITASSAFTGVLYVLKHNGLLIQTQTPAGTSAIFSGLAPNTYTVTAYKNKAIGPTTQSVIVTNADQAVAF
ncbi:MAG TPA: hypothetical protein VEI96_07110, partial [Thermodesulfovibrionales bacterium]|nr:hypothetical protein [Thermodesulfovibrionales bacterium]